MAEMKAYNMVNTAGCYNINTGGRVMALGDHGRVKPHHNPMVGSYKNEIEPAWRRKAREMVEQSKSFYPSPRESALERELWKQSTGGDRAAVNVSPKLAADYAAYQSRLSREDELTRQLFDQINAR